MKLYEETGYFNADAALMNNRVFTFVIGARGTGKTYGVLKKALEFKHPFIMLRRTQSECDKIIAGALNPFKAVAHDAGVVVYVEKLGKDVGGIYKEINGDKVFMGYILALSTFANVRGVDFSDVSYIIYDEFIPEKQVRPIREEGSALLNMYETVNRNRELNGSDPVKFIALANSNDIANPVFITLGIVDRVAKMMEKGIESFYDDARSLAVYMLMHSPISERKAETALYKLAVNTGYADMAIRNIFELDNTYVKSRPLSEYRPVVRCGEMVLYEHKGRNEYYCRMGVSGTVPSTYGTSDVERERFRNRYQRFYLRYLSGLIYFESTSAMVYFEHIYK